MKMSNIETFEGIYVAMYSAYEEKGEVGAERVKKLARYYVRDFSSWLIAF
ncbi:dihydrodipicolinate synthase/N-acetylneuraminate lyase [Paenibacillus endophyticus]|uniref:Dihydrodipicolinate synthase/N-acetylneuraminate lyase n=1 Tax=Paenibacillus endophyticus TaxID=1294268 RepID=A0A7W5GCT4_9BACL|nr:dihydrodipicolinate synthase/N-acetylneuraminate lyase [Paenibacillus endophyticus]